MSGPGSDEALRELAAKAATLWERLDGRYVPLPGAEGRRLALERLDRWREKAAGGRPELFERRLSWCGVSSQRALEVLGELRLEGPLPAWTRTLKHALRLTASGSRTRGLPFEEVLAPFAEAAVSLLEPSVRAPFTPEAFDTLVGDLMTELSYIAAPALQEEFTRWRAGQGEASSTSRRLYTAFTARLREGGLWDFFREYAALARLLSRLVELWVLNVSEFARALVEDGEEIERLFPERAPVGRVVALALSLSDRHNGGRCVARVEFESGLRLFYKPRGLGIERAWYTLLERLNGWGADLRVLRVLDRGDRGWAEPAEHRPCENLPEARLFYVRAGMLLALLYALEASDCFYENLIASGPYPVLIDMEALMHPVLEWGAASDSIHEPAHELLLNSVFRVGLLPSWDTGPGGECVDISGLGATAGQVTSYLKRRWRHVNTDAMALEHEPIRVETEDHLPKLGGVSLRAPLHAAPLLEGFQRMYRLLVRHREELLSDEGPLRELSAQPLRILFHATRLYSLILKRLCAPRHLRSGVERSIEMDLLSRFHLESAHGDRSWPLLEAELEALEQLDLPLFSVRADRAVLTLPTGARLEEAIQESGLARVRRRLASLHEGDLELQTRFIRSSLSLALSAPAPGPSRRPASWAHARPLSPEQLVAEALSIARQLEAQALFLESGEGVTWLAPQLLPRSSRHQLRPLRMDLYNGLAGLALFFSALAHVSGQGRRVARAAVSTLRAFVSSVDARSAARAGYGIGATQGAGSFVYTLCRCALLLEEPALLADAERAARLIVPEWEDATDTFDVMSGAAGAILGLLTLYRATGDGAALEKAVRCGEHLLKHQHPAPRGGAAWRMKGRLLTGFSHGAAGISLALLRLHAVTAEARWREAARRAVDFETSVFLEAEGQWPDLRGAREGGSEPMNAWCHGAVGIGLARASGLSVSECARARHDLDAALSTLVRRGLGERDGLCCGNLGGTELWLLAARVKEDPRLEELAIHRASQVVNRARVEGYCFSGPEGARLFDPSFFQGLSGVGYQLLRLASPRRLPSVLALE